MLIEHLQFAFAFSVRHVRPKIHSPFPCSRAVSASSSRVNWQNAKGICFRLSRRILTKTVPKRLKTRVTSASSSASSMR